jgi:hypothetical protein
MCMGTHVAALCKHHLEDTPQGPHADTVRPHGLNQLHDLRWA